MCEVSPTCRRKPKWWVQSSYLSANVLACPTHLQQAVHAVHNAVASIPAQAQARTRTPHVPYVTVRQRTDWIDPLSGAVREVWR